MREYCDSVSEVSSNCLKQMKGITNSSRYSGQKCGVQVTLYPMLLLNSEIFLEKSRSVFHLFAHWINCTDFTLRGK